MATQLIILIVLGILLLIFALYFIPIGLWLTAMFTGAQISIMELFFMRIRKSPVKEIVYSLITCTKAGVQLTKVDLESHALAGGDIVAVVKTMIMAKNQNIPLSFKEATAIDLAGKDLDQFLELKKNQTTPGYDEKRVALANKISHQLTDNQIDDLERFMERLD